MHLVILSAVLLLLAIDLGWQATRHMLSPITLTIALFLLYYIGGLYYFFTEGHSLVVLYIAIGAFCYVVGAIVAASRLRFRPMKELQDFREAPFESLFPYKGAFFISLLLFGVLSIILVVYYFYDAGIPLFSEWSSKARTLRVAGRGLYIRAGMTFLPLTLIMAYLYRKFAVNFSSKLFLLLLLAASIVYIILYGSRSIALAYLIPFVLVYGVVCKRKAFKKAYALCLIFLASALVIQYTYKSYRHLPVRDALSILFGRLTTQQVQGFDYIVYDMPPQSLFRGQAHSMGIKGILSTLRIIPHGPPFGVILFYMKTGNTNIPFSMVPTTFGVLYVDFGLAGICAGMFLYGFIAEALYIKMLRYHKDFFLFPIISYCQYIIICAHIGGGFFAIIAHKGISMALTTLTLMIFYIVLALPKGRIPVFACKRRTAAFRNNGKAQ